MENFCHLHSSILLIRNDLVLWFFIPFMFFQGDFLPVYSFMVMTICFLCPYVTQQQIYIVSLDKSWRILSENSSLVLLQIIMFAITAFIVLYQKIDYKVGNILQAMCSLTFLWYKTAFHSVDKARVCRGHAISIKKPALTDSATIWWVKVRQYSQSNTF